jgi:hypothetical protein
VYLNCYFGASAARKQGAIRLFQVTTDPPDRLVAGEPIVSVIDAGAGQIAHGVDHGQPDTGAGDIEQEMQFGYLAIVVSNRVIPGLRWSAATDDGKRSGRLPGIGGSSAFSGRLAQASAQSTP